MSGWGWVRAGAVLGFLGVGLGAFGAHGLKDLLAKLGTSATFQTAVQYQMYHAAAILAVGLLCLTGNCRPGVNVAGWAFLAGVVIFSGSLYVLSVTGMKWLGAITPFGGVAFLVGWLALAVAAGMAGGAEVGVKAARSSMSAGWAVEASTHAGDPR
jgi:uncharacterized membrane protein YgdD (TMEM256/DUF423 family)